ncbi:hypothetical protein ACQKEF_23260 [Pseudomonas oryzihabitans]|uniref:hypothetical protein n=1 Tax=Pseudomonas oryzihabitans TaxID=47885 RepID=UPI003CFED9AB
MTIVKSSQFLCNYPFQVLPEALVECFRRGATGIENFETVLKLFEAFCHISGVKIQYPEITSQEIRRLVTGFFGALQSTSFYNGLPASRRALIVKLTKALNKLKLEGAPHFSVDWNSINKSESIQVWFEAKKKLNKKAVRYWNGWEVISQKGVSQYLPIPILWRSHGERFAEEMYLNWKMNCEKHQRPNNSTFNKLANYLANNSKKFPASSFYNPIEIKAPILAFMKEYFLQVHKEHRDIPSQIRTWSTFIVGCEEAFIQSGVWATPFGEGLPKPKCKTPPGKRTRIKQTSEGAEIQCKLITHVPMHITDEQAIDILFKEIDRDITVVKAWASQCAQNLYRRAKRRCRYAKKGQPTKSSAGVKSAHEIGFNNICATFEAEGFITGKNILHKSYGYRTNLASLAHELGLPTADSLFCYQCLLISEHPQITPGFLERHLLYDKHGHRTGFFYKKDKGQLLGSKPRRGTTHSQQKINLTPQSIKWIKQIIKITQPLRTYLREAGDDTWRYLFLSCGKGFSPPIRPSRTRWTSSRLTGDRSTKVESQFLTATELRGEALRDFLARVNLSSLRASCGVSIYIKTKSATEMAKALGHLRYDRHLLRHYLPEEILQFFQSRWIRIFQRSMICEARKSSPVLLKATSFESMEELHEFLKNHALKEIPNHIKDPTYLQRDNETIEPKHQVFVSIDTGIMTALLSLERAVNASPSQDQISATAKYWAELSRAVERDISTSNDTILKRHLAIAMENCDQVAMEKLIYEIPRRA